MKRKTLLAIVAILTLVTLACSLTGGGAGEEAPESAQPPAASGGEQPAPVDESSGEQPASPDESGGEQPAPADESGGEQPAPSDESEGASEVAGLDTLDSYRLYVKWSGESEDGSQSYEMTLREEWVKEPPARHLVMSMSDGSSEPAPFLESLTVGDTTWIKMGETWLQTSAPDEFALGEGMTDVWEGIMTGEAEDLILEGEETVNGVYCRHYTTSGETSFTVPDPQEGGTVTVNVQGEAWIADQPGLPSIVVRERAQIEGGFLPVFAGAGTAGEAAMMYWEYDVTDINTTIIIEPPE